MFCKDCGKEVEKAAIACMGCGCDPMKGDKFCRYCGASVNQDQVVCVKCGRAIKRQNDSAGASAGGSAKSRTTAALLAIFLGGFGAHVRAQFCAVQIVSLDVDDGGALGTTRPAGFALEIVVEGANIGEDAPLAEVFDVKTRCGTCAQNRREFATPLILPILPKTPPPPRPRKW